MIPAHLIRLVRQKRLIEGYSLRALGRSTGVSFSSLARIERGEGQPDRHTARALEVWLWPERQPPPCHCPRCTGTGTRLGWECPHCHRCYAPSIEACPQCGPQETPP
jgi:hypothetical protein